MAAPDDCHSVGLGGVWCLLATFSPSTANVCRRFFSYGLDAGIPNEPSAWLNECLQANYYCFLVVSPLLPALLSMRLNPHAPRGFQFSWIVSCHGTHRRRLSLCAVLASLSATSAAWKRELIPCPQSKLSAFYWITTGSFEREYQQYYLPGKPNPKPLQTLLLHHPESAHGVLLIPGLMAAPEEVRGTCRVSVFAGLYGLRTRDGRAWYLGHRPGGTPNEQWLDSVNQGHHISQMLLRTHPWLPVFQPELPSHQGPYPMRSLIALRRWNSKVFGKLCCAAKRLFLQTDRWSLFTSPAAVQNFVTIMPNPHINFCVAGKQHRADSAINEGPAGVSREHRYSNPDHPCERRPEKLDVASGQKHLSSSHQTQILSEIDFHLHGIVRADYQTGLQCNWGISY